MVSVASKKAEKISDAPSIISTVTAEEIQRYGARNLTDILNRVPGLQYTSGLFFQNNSFSVRGQSVQHYPNRILFLINGRPYRDSLSGGYNMPLFTDFPVSTIERLEIIRGPGSVLYGSNAFSSVINIVTRKTAAGGEAEFLGTYGSHDYQSGELTVGESGADWDMLAAFRSTDQNATYTPYIDEFTTAGSLRDDDSGRSALVALNYKNLSINGFKTKSEQNLMGIVLPSVYYDISRSFLDIGYHAPLSDSWSADANVTLNNLELQSYTTDDRIFELELHGELQDNLNLLFGAAYETQQVTTPFNTDDTGHWYSTNAQADYRPLHWLKLVAGIQMNKPQNSEADFSPRLAAIANIDKNWGAKILYGEAFRTGYALETIVFVPDILINNPSLKPEKIATTEMQLNYHENSFEGALTLYHSKTTDIISRIPSPGGGLTYTNSGEVNFRGIELEGKARLGAGWSTQGSIGWQENEDDDGRRDVTFSGNLMVKAGLSYAAKDDAYSLGVFNSYFSRPTQVSDANPTALVANPDAGSYYLMTLNASLNLNKLGLGNAFPDTNFIFYIDNLMDQEIYYPEYNRQNINSYPVQPGRTIYGMLKVRF